MKENKTNLAIVYNIGALKSAFEEIRWERIREMRCYPPQICDEENKTIPSSFVSCIYEHRVGEAIKALEILKHFNNEDYIGFSSVPLKPFITHYLSSEYSILTEAEIRESAPEALLRPN